MIPERVFYYIYIRINSYDNFPDAIFPPRLPPPGKRISGAAIIVNNNNIILYYYHFLAQHGPFFTSYDTDILQRLSHTCI